MTKQSHAAITGFWAVFLFLSMAPTAMAGHKETYHILQKGFIEVKGNTNLFQFSGKSIHFSGQLDESEEGTYTGEVVLRFDQISFGLPGVRSVLKDPGYLNTVAYPTIHMRLDRFDPEQKPDFVAGFLTLHKIRQKIQIQSDIFDVSPIVRVKGRFSVKQSDFNVRPYRSSLIQIDDRLEIRFLLFFCETHDRIPDDEPVVGDALQKILDAEGITILRESDFYGCRELKPIRSEKNTP